MTTAAKPDAADQAKDADTQSPDTAKAGKSGKISPVTLIVSALVSFVVFLGIFSYTMGVFDDAPEAEPEAATNTHDSDQTDAAAANDSGQYYSQYGEAAAAVEAAHESKAVDTIAELSLLDRRKRELEAEERTVEGKKRELEALRTEVEQLLGKKEKIAKEKTVYIAKLIDGMKPEDMSGLIANLDNSTILAVLPQMKPQTASRVLSLLPPKRAAQITTELLFSEPKVNTP